MKPPEMNNILSFEGERRGGAYLVGVGNHNLHSLCLQTHVSQQCQWRYDLSINSWKNKRRMKKMATIMLLKEFDTVELLRTIDISVT